MQLSKKSNWVEKSQDMYNFEQKPIGHDRKEVEGEFPKSIPNTWTEIKGVSKPQPQYLPGDTVQWADTGNQQMAELGTGLTYSGKVEKVNYSQSYQQFMYTIRGWNPQSQVWRTFTKWESDLKPAQGNLILSKKKPWWKEHEEKYDLGSLVPDEITVEPDAKKKRKKKEREEMQLSKRGAMTPSEVTPSFDTKMMGFGTWDCPRCHSRNPDRYRECPACFTPKPQTLPLLNQPRAMKVTAGDVIPFDQTRRKPKVQEIPMNPQNQPEGQVGEEQASVYYEYDNLLINLKELFNQFKALGEMEVVERIGRALAALENEY